MVANQDQGGSEKRPQWLLIRTRVVPKNVPGSIKKRPWWMLKGPGADEKRSALVTEKTGRGWFQKTSGGMLKGPGPGQKGSLVDVIRLEVALKRAGLPGR